MNARLAFGIATLSAGAFALGCAGARPAPSAASTAPQVPVPEALALPAGEVRAFELHARGTQNYECRESRDVPGRWEWGFVAPEAGNLIGKHYAGPTWESTADGSKVVGKAAARADAADPDAIPWLLLQVTEASGSGMFSGVKSVQRVDTHGGKAPTSGCDQSAAGSATKVPYTAAYEFSRASP